MAPYALTPTSERGEYPNGFDFNVHTNGTNGLNAINGTNGSNATNGTNGSNATNGTNGVSDTNGANGTNDQINGHTSGGSTPTSTTSYEAAYVHGYKDGYSKSHVELKHQPIAIIGMSCRFPGSVSTPDEFWELLARSRTGFSPIPPERFSANRFFHPNPGKSGTTNARGGNFLTHDLTVFDAPFFGFTQQEAISLDPQQRLLLECTFEALESAGIPKHYVVGKDVGVFVGGSFAEYDADLFRDADTIPMHQATGNHMAMQANRISHFFDFRGPSYTVDTACSSSLVALHNACQSLRYGESSVAIAAGVHLNMLPEFWISMSMSRLFGEAGRSFAFDQRGSGYGRGEGCCMLMLKPLDQAIKDNDPIRAVITGTGINQDGKTPGITMPNGSAQEALIRSVYQAGGMDPKDTGYVEAHGTGTRVGDPIEVSALQKVFGEGRNKRKPLYIGSVKSNIGHLEAAAGIAGVIKTALMLERGFILPNYDFKQPNEKLPLDQWGFKVATRQQPWPFGKRWASVNGFGFGGTNGHVVLTKGPLERKTMSEEIDTQTAERLFLISANDKASTERVMQNLGIYLEQRPEVFQNDLLSNLAYTLGERKSLHPWRVAITASSAAQLVEALSSGRVLPAKQELEAPRLGWIFTGQGAQWWAMGRELYQQYPVYATSLDKADAHLLSIGADFSLRNELEKEEKATQVNAAHISQPSCTAVQLALTDLLHSWGVRPSAVAGHSSGEIGAAYAAGIITFEDAMTVAYHRGRLIPILKKKYPDLDGCMMAVGAGTTEITPLLDRVPSASGDVRIACINSPSSVTVSGDAAAVADLQDIIEEVYPGMFARKLQVDTAYHSHHMNLVAKEYTESLLHLQPPQPTNIKFHSSLLGRLATSLELDASYWVQNLTCAVRFDDAVQSMSQPADGSKTGVDFLVELGPHAALQGPIKQILKHVGGPAVKIAYSSVLARKKDAVQTALALAGALFVKGTSLSMGAVNFPKTLERQPQVLTDMPRYPWNHSAKFYHESRLTQIHKFHDAPRNDIIGVLAPYSNDMEPTWRNVVRLDDLPWLRHHQMQGVTIFPISGFAVMALEAIAQLANAKDLQYDSLDIRSLSVMVPVMLTEEELEMTITLRTDAGDDSSDLASSFVIRSWSKTKGWSEHCTGSVSCRSADLNEVDGLRLQQTKQEKLKSRITTITDTAAEPIVAQSLYERLSDLGVSYGATFQGVGDCRASPRASMAQIILADTKADMPHHHETNYILHPTLLETLISLYWPVLSTNGPLDTVHLPSSIGKVSVSSKVCEHLQGPGSRLQSYCAPSGPLSNVSPSHISMFATSLLEPNEALISVEDVSISPILEKAMDAEVEGPRELCYKLEWEPAFPDPEVATNSIASIQFGAEVVIVHGDTEAQLAMASAVSDGLVDLVGTRPTMGSLTDIASLAKDKLCIFLPELSQPVLANLDAVQFEALQCLLTNVRGLLWVVQGAYGSSTNPDANMIAGLSRTLRSEGTLMKFITLDLDLSTELVGPAGISTLLKVFTATLATNSKIEETEFMERDGSLFTPRIVNDETMNEFVDKQIHPSTFEPASFTDQKRPLRAVVATSGADDNITFEDDKSIEVPLPEDHIAFQVKAVGLSARGIPADSAIDMEPSGIVTSVGSDVPNIKVGDRIAAMTANGSLSTVARAHFRSVFKLPDHISFESAATIPRAYCTASYALIQQAKLLEGETVLVHDAASAVGQAGLALARMIGAEAWTTVKSANEKVLLMREFGLPEDRIWYTGSETFAESIRDATGDKGVDVVFNTLSDSHLQATWSCLANFGRFINVGTGHVRLGDMPPSKNATVLSVDIAALATHRPRDLERTLADIARLLHYGKIHRVHQVNERRVSELAAALQSLWIASDNRKVVIVPQDDDLVMAPRAEKGNALLRQDATYILIGGTGGLGRSIATWMVGKGARHIVLLSRSGEVKGKAKEQIDVLNTAGAAIVVRRCDVADRSDVEKLLTTGLTDLPPVRGIVHGAMVLHDVLFEKMTHQQYKTVIESKVQGAWNFHHALSAIQTPLDFFICISSAAGAIGNRGQAAYAAANTFLNGFAQYLRGQGVPATSIDLTAVSDAGYLAKDAEKAAEVARNLGSDTICEAEVLSLIQASIEGQMASCNGHPITGMRITPTMRPFWSNDAKFVHLLRAAEAATVSTAAATVSWSAAFKAASTRAEAEQVVCSALVEKIAEVISMEPEELDVTRALSHYPLDSLTAIEVRNFITRMFEASLQVLELLASGSIEALAKVVAGKSKARTWEG
ncbi:ketoacyl-synt-domain-containing protein [Lentithecium fluviatile CBS 122367]|uniref:Ketoacyl-synt-domain-containing protein n=1 Tax=Lentithecium fluviatile CBS 122367 TaxID=1168545 RepID=A0A6G1ILC5_9PLEO|nr:ketoacyl-synt-domain-containing protein [Lentithecium fluviatile CBS 122367]